MNWNRQFHQCSAVHINMLHTKSSSRFHVSLRLNSLQRIEMGTNCTSLHRRKTVCCVILRRHLLTVHCVVQWVEPMSSQSIHSFTTSFVNKSLSFTLNRLDIINFWKRTVFSLPQTVNSVSANFELCTRFFHCTSFNVSACWPLRKCVGHRQTVSWSVLFLECP